MYFFERKYIFQSRISYSPHHISATLQRYFYISVTYMLVFSCIWNSYEKLRKDGNGGIKTISYFLISQVKYTKVLQKIHLQYCLISWKIPMVYIKNTRHERRSLLFVNSFSKLHI